MLLVPFMYFSTTAVTLLVVAFNPTILYSSLVIYIRKIIKSKYH